MGSRNRFEHETATSLDQAFLDRAADNLNNELVLAVDIETPQQGTTIRVSDRHCYVGPRFYEARTTFPVIKKTLGQWLNPQLEFSTLDIEINNVDGKYSNLGRPKEWIGKEVTVRLGLRDVESTFRPIFQGSISPEGGYQGDIASIKIKARSKYEKLNINIPKLVFTVDSQEKLEDSFEGLGIPIVVGDWSSITDTADRPPLPCTPINTGDPNVNGRDDNPNRGPLQIQIAINPMQSIESYWLKRGDKYYPIPDTYITAYTDLSGFELRQRFGIGSEVWEYENGDEFYIYGIGKPIYNPVAQARWLLEEFAEVPANELDYSWQYFSDKFDQNSIRSRLWIQESVGLFEYVLSLLEQVQLEVFVERRNFRLKLNSLDPQEQLNQIHSASYKIQNWDIVKDSLNIGIDDQNFFNRVRGAYNSLPSVGENVRHTNFQADKESIERSSLEISKELVFPNLYQTELVQNQLKKILPRASNTIQILDCELTWRSLLIDLGNVIKVNIQIQNVVLENVACMVREVGYDPNGLKIPVRLWR